MLKVSQKKIKYVYILFLTFLSLEKGIWLNETSKSMKNTIVI